MERADNDGAEGSKGGYLMYLQQVKITSGFFLKTFFELRWSSQTTHLRRETLDEAAGTPLMNNQRYPLADFSTCAEDPHNIHTLITASMTIHIPSPICRLPWSKGQFCLIDWPL
jgi:hypothetical protein